MESKNILELFSPDPIKAEVIYQQTRRRLVFMFRFFDDPEDLADEVFWRVLARLAEDKFRLERDLLAYIYGIARIVKLEQSRERKFFEFDESVMQMAAKPENDNYKEKLFQIIEDCIEKLNPKDKELFLEYVFPPENLSAKEHRKAMTEKWDKEIGNLRVKYHRIVEVLRVRSKAQLSSCLETQNRG